VDLAQNARRPLRQWADWFADFLAQLLRVSLLKKELQGHSGLSADLSRLGSSLLRVRRRICSGVGAAVARNCRRRP